MAVLVDTNVLLRRVQINHPQHRAAVECVERMLDAGETLCFTPQNIAEFWCVMTRPASSNGLGLSTFETAARVEQIEGVLTLLPDVPEIFPEWRRLVTQHNVSGVKVHDTRLVASMNVHAIRRLLTFNTADFARFAIEVLNPSSS